MRISIFPFNIGHRRQRQRRAQARREGLERPWVGPVTPLAYHNTPEGRRELRALIPPPQPVPARKYFAPDAKTGSHRRRTTPKALGEFQIPQRAAPGGVRKERVVGAENCVHTQQPTAASPV